MINKSKYLYLSILLLFLVVRIPGIGNDISNTDAYRWHKRSEAFLEALKSGNFQETYQHYQPGVTIMWLNSFVKQAAFSFQYRIQKNPSPRTLENADWYPIIHGISKLAILVVLVSLLFWQIFVLKKLFDEKIAFIFAFFMTLEPYLIGIDRWFHLTSLEMYFAFTALLFTLWWYKKGDNKYLIFSGILVSFSVLSKVTTMLILPVFIFLIIKKSLYDRELLLKNVLKNSFLFAFSFAITTFVFFPALWLEPISTLENMISAGLQVASQQDTYPLLTAFSKIIFYDLILLYKLSPVTIVLFVFGLLNIRKITKNFSLMIILVTFLIYYLFFSLFQKKIDRYAISMFPYVVILASYSFFLLKDKAKKLFILLSVFYFIYVSYIYYPVYSAYYSPLLGGTKTALNLGLYDNSGEYFAQAAHYLNSKGRDIRVHVPDGTPSFSYYFRGELSYRLHADVDYLVTSYDSDRKEVDHLGCDQLESKFGSREYKVVFVYRCK